MACPCRLSLLNLSHVDPEWCAGASGFPVADEAASSIFDELPYPRRRERQCARLNAERAERGCDRVRQCAADRDDAALPCPLGAERIVRRWVKLERDRGETRIVGRDRDQVVGQRSDEELAVLVIDDLLGEHAA